MSTRITDLTGIQGAVGQLLNLEDRLHVLPAWRETGWFDDRERAALAWAEAVTAPRAGEVADSVFDQARAEFSEEELGDLTLAVIAIDGCNRANIALRLQGPDRFVNTER